jgi:hypothetical protein
MKRKLIIIAVIILIVSSCARTYTPHHAASHRMKCGKGRLK